MDYSTTSPVAVREAVGSGVGMFTNLRASLWEAARFEFVAYRITVACVLFPKRMRMPEWLPELGLSSCKAGLRGDCPQRVGEMFSRA